MEEMVKEEILRKCKRNIVPTEEYNEEEENEEPKYEDTFEETESIFEKELPFQDILAEKRRKYSPEEDFIYLLYNDILKYFITKWDSHVLRKKYCSKVDEELISIEYEEDEDSSTRENKNMDELVKKSHSFEESKKSEDFPSSWKLRLPDEFANITFFNNNSYSGRISRKMMEGEGVYKWNNGVQYKGNFEKNQIEGKGLLEWNNSCWYEGDFKNGYFHGRGLMVDKENDYMYTGEWHTSQRHGKGYCRYGNNSSYDGDWIRDEMHGTGLRIYPSGSRYIGQWKNSLRHGNGTMAWSNGDVYRGEWRCGEMNGHGEYIWNGFLNTTLCLPRVDYYIGDWQHGMRDGRGLLKLNTIGGTTYSGYWKDNQKHGYGMIIGNNGDKIESDSLFLNDILVSSVETEDMSKNQVECKNANCKQASEDTILSFLEKPVKLTKAPILPVLKPEQFPSLTYHLSRLLNIKDSKTSSTDSLLSGRCDVCESIESCHCLMEYADDLLPSERKISEETISAAKLRVGDKTIEWEYEERWIKNCLTVHMPRIRQIYNDYAGVFATVPPKCNLVMSRLCLWQLWRDCGINRKNFSLIDIDQHIEKNPSALIDDPYHPFEKLEIWQFLHALLEVSWHCYTKYDNAKIEATHGKLASGLHKLLETDVYPNIGNHIGNIWQKYRDLLPFSAVYELYRQIEYPMSARDLLRAACVSKDTSNASLSSSVHESSITRLQHFLGGSNCSTVGEKISYLSKLKNNFFQSQDASTNYENDLDKELLAFQELGASKIIEIIILVCPSIKDNDNDIIINMEYRLTFLEFYEIILEATKQLLCLRKKNRKVNENSEPDSASFENDNLKEK